MRIRKRTPARAASPGLSASPPPPFLPLPLLQQPKEKPEPQEDKEEEDGAEQQQEEKRVILIAGALVDPVPAAAAAAAAAENVTTDGELPKPDVARCSRNDGKRWRCKSAAAPGYLFCDRHVAWSTRKRKPRPRPAKKKLTSRGGAEDEIGGGFVVQQTGCRKRAKDGGSGTGPAA